MMPEVVVILLISLLVLLGGLALISLTAYQAYRRGYNPITWGIAAILALNPIFLLVVLAVSPHRSRVRLRDRFTAELDAKLAAGTRSVGAGGTAAVDAAAPTATAGRPPGSPVGRSTDLSVTRSMDTRPKDGPS
jgi:hypothetical protein